MTNLTESEIDALEAGERLDALIAIHVMDWKLTDRRPPDIKNWSNYPDEWYEEPDGFLSNVTSIPPYSTEIAAAWGVWKRMPEAKALDEAGGLFSARFHCEWGAGGWELGYYAVGSTPMLAVCKAALKVVMLG